MSPPPEIERMRRSTLYLAAPFCLLLALVLLAIVVDEHGLTYGPIIAGVAAGAVVALVLVAVLVARRNVRPSAREVERAQSQWLSARTGIVGATAGIGLLIAYGLASSPDLEAFVLAFIAVLFLALAPLAWLIAFLRRGLYDDGGGR